MSFSDLGFFQWLKSIYDGFILTLQRGDTREIAYHFFIVFVTSSLLALFLYIFNNKLKHYLLIDLGFHKWLIK